MSAELEKIREAMLLTKALTEKRMQTDPVYVELATALACLGRARRLLGEREAEMANG